MSYSVPQLLGLFLVYAFLGWCVEVCFVAVTSGKVVNRGFLNGPVCPIYGVGMLGVLLLLEPVAGRLPLLFLGGALLCTAVELAGGWILEQVFHTRWWDYTDQPFNLGGYVCLGFSLMWGLAVTFVVRLVHPFMFTLLKLIPHTLGIVLLAVFYALFVTDLVMTLITIVGIRKRMGEMEKVAGALHAVGDTISGRLGNRALAADAELDELRENGQEKMEAAREARQERMAEGREKLSAAVEAHQERVAENREKVAAAIESGQQKWDEAREFSRQRRDESRERLESRVSETMEELLEKKERLEQRRQKLLAEYRSRPGFGQRRLGKAFPAVKKAIQEHLDELDRE